MLKKAFGILFLIAFVLLGIDLVNVLTTVLKEPTNYNLGFLTGMSLIWLVFGFLSYLLLRKPKK